tara:strand:- start:4648 stop:5592 length:945 start_codon:yes stop_codon:yes gene_type:complete
MKNSIVVIGAHLTNYKSNLLLTNLINSILELKMEYGLVSNSLIPENHYKDAKFFMYDSENEKFLNTPSSNFWFQNKNFIIESPFLFYGSISNYSYGATNLFINSVLLSKKYEYDFVHWLEYDSDLLIDEIKDNEKIMNENDYSVVVYNTESEGHPISGRFISVNLNKINLENFYKNKQERKDVLNKYGNSGEKFIKNYLLKYEKIFEKNVNVCGQNNFNQANNNPVEFVFLNDKGNILFFIKNNSNNVLEYKLKGNDFSYDKKLNPNSWTIFPIGDLLKITYVLLEYYDKYFFMDTTNSDDVEKYINVNKFTKK